MLKLFHPWKSAARLDSFHFMRRFNCGPTEHHPLYGTFCSKLSSCLFEWDQEDVQHLKEAKRAEWKGSHGGHAPTDDQLMASISPRELKKHCRRRIRGVEEIRRMISGLLESVWELTDTTGLRLVNPDSMQHVWDGEQKHLECLQDLQGLSCTQKWGHSRRVARSWMSSGVVGGPPPWRVSTDTSVLSFQVHSHQHTLYCRFFSYVLLYVMTKNMFQLFKITQLPLPGIHMYSL